MAKYIIELNPDCVEGEFLKIPVRVTGEFQWIKTKSSLTPYTEPDRKAIEDEVWEFATTCTKMDGADSVDVFGGFSLDSFTKYSYQEAKAKYEAWKKEKEEIHIGDEVQYSLAGYEYTFIVFGKENDVLYGIRSDCEDGLDNLDDIYEGWDYCNKSDSTLVKTGRHFDEVESLLKKMEVD